MQNTNWTDQQLYLTSGCQRVSEGCKNCPAIAKILTTTGEPAKRYDGLIKNGEWTGQAKVDWEELQCPQQRTTPTRFALEGLGDFFFRGVHWLDISNILCKLKEFPQHTFLFATKRPNQMRKHINDFYIKTAIPAHQPVENFWLGIKVESQETLVQRWRWLIQTPAKVRFLHISPMLEPVNLKKLYCHPDWVIVEGEKNKKQKINGVKIAQPEPRAFHIEWLLELYKQCYQLDIPVFFVGLGDNPYWKGKPLNKEQAIAREKILERKEFPRA